MGPLFLTLALALKRERSGESLSEAGELEGFEGGPKGSLTVIMWLEIEL